MKERKEIKKFIIIAEIYDTELPQKIHNELSSNLPELDKEYYYNLDIVFSKSVYRCMEFYQYPLEKTLEQKEGKQSDTKELISNILSEQLNKVLKEIETLEFDLGSSGIIGDNIDNHNIEVTLYRGDKKEYRKNGNLMPHIRANSIMPDRPYILERAVKVFTDICLRKMEEDKKKELEKNNHTPNMIKAEIVFKSLAEVIDDIDTESMLSEAIIESDWPLKLKKGTKTEVANNPISKNTYLDCPEFLLYKENTDGFWTLEKIEDLKEAKYIITREGFNLKRTAEIVVLKTLKPVLFSLFEETDEGLVEVDKENARGKKKLNLIWNK